MANGSGEHRVILHSDCNCYYASVEMIARVFLCDLSEETLDFIRKKRDVSAAS